MRIGLQVAPTALAEKLKAAGFPQNTCFAWYIDRSVWMVEAAGLGTVMRGLGDQEFTEHCAAPTVAEMGEWLPDSCLLAKREDGRWSVIGMPIRDMVGIEEQIAALVCSSEAEIRARILLALTLSGVINPKGLK